MFKFCKIGRCAVIRVYLPKKEEHHKICRKGKPRAPRMVGPIGAAQWEVFSRSKLLADVLHRVVKML
jgi:hypothetical protein